MRLLALCLLFLQQQAPDPNQKQTFVIVQPAPPPSVWNPNVFEPTPLQIQQEADRACNQWKDVKEQWAACHSGWIQGYGFRERLPRPTQDQGRHVSDPPKEPPSVANVAGLGWVANAAALRQHIKSAKKPQASGNGIVALRLMITATGAVRKADVTAARDPLQRAAVLKAAESWTFTPFSQGDVIAIVPITFRNGTAHSALWD